MADQIELLKSALEISPESWPTRRYLIEHFASEGDVESAAALVQAAPGIPEDEVERLFAAEVLAKSDPQAARSLLDEILSCNAACAQAHVIKAAIHQSAGDHEKAASHVKVAQVLAPDLDVDQAIAEAVARPEAPPEVLPLEVSQAVQIMTGRVAESAVEVEADAAVEPVAQVVEEEVEEEVPVTPVPLAAAPLRPPGEERISSGEPIPVVPAPADSDYQDSGILPPPLHAAEVTDDVVFGEMPTDEELEEAESAGERAFIVGDGEMVHAHNKQSDTKEKVSSLVVALLVNLALVLLAYKLVVFNQKNDPPAFVVSNAPEADKDELPNEKVVKKQRAAASIQQAAPVVTVSAISDVAVPEITQDLDMALVTLGNNTGVGFSMSPGMGDVSNMGSIPATMRSRCSMSQRMKQLRESGGEERVEGAVRKALEFIASKQNKETGQIGEEFPAAMTGLSLLAFLGHCETPESHKFGTTVILAAQYLMGISDDGKLYNGKPGHHMAYEHGIATYALAELHTMTKEGGREIPKLESVLRRAVKVIVDGQTSDGGWNYGYGGESNGDYSVSGWQIQALKAAYNTGERFSNVDKSLNNAMKYTKMAQDEQGAIRYRLDGKPGKPTLAGAGVLALQMWKHADSPEADLGLKYIAANYMNPASQTYSAYYNTQAAFLKGGPQWDQYNAKYQKALLDRQNEDGSWTSGGGHGPKGEEAHVYTTALSTLMLEVYYRYLPTTEKLEGLKRME